MKRFFSHLVDETFGGQNQIVNQQEQQKEVNPGGLSQTDDEKTLFGPVEEQKNTANELERAKEDELPKKAEKAE